MAGLQLAVVIAYVAAAVMGFRLAFVAEQITTVWAPTGIAIAALLVGGLRLWPAIWIGAFIANLTTTAPGWTALVVASGNTLEAVVAVWYLRRIPRFNVAFSRIADVAAFIVVAAAACTAISATIGVVALCMAAVQPWDRFPVLWFDWWLGDALGAAIVAPAIATALTRAWSRPAILHAIAWVAGALVIADLVFGQVLGVSPHPLEYVVFPLAIAAAVNGGPAVTPWVVLSASVVAIWHTIHGVGPFASSEVHYSLVLVQVFMGVLAATSMLLAASVAERRMTQSREREAAAGLKHRQELLRMAQRAGGVATFEWDFQNQIAQCSAEFFNLFGLAAEDGVMTGARWAGFVHPDDRERMATHLARALEGREPAAADYRIVTADGTTRWLSYAGQIQRTAAGDRLLGTVVDVTERKRSEIALRDAKLAAESANALKDQFLATLSHELRTPLNAILGYARMLQTNAIPPEKRQHAIDVIERNAVAQAQLVEDLLDMSRITTGKVRLDAIPVAAVTVLRNALEGIKPAADAKAITLTIDIDSSSALVRADTSRLQQVFWNLLTNAVKFTGDGGTVRVTLRQDGPNVEMSVSDSGAGISPEFLPFVFDAFRQADSRFDRAHGGLGLGLAITRQLVELHGGTIAASSPGIGRGATFTVTLPCMR